MSERWLWTQKQDMGPSPRQGHAMVYDPKRKRVLLFGGRPPGVSVLGDTWEWDGGAWVQVADMGPPARAHASMAYDATNKCAVLFGGIPKFGDTWIWNGEEWTQAADMGPSGRSSHAMVFDSTRERVLLHGGTTGEPIQGSDNTISAFSDTWEWDGTEWQQIADTGPARYDHTFVFDNARSKSLLFGGMRESGAMLHDTWEFSDSRWIQRQNMGPQLIGTATAVSTKTRTVLFGGGANQAGETWEWNGSLWTRRQNMGPATRAFHALAYDQDRDRIVLFGGSSSTNGASPFFSDTWELAIQSQ